MCMELEMHLRFPVAGGGGSSTFSGQAGYISVLFAHGRPSECSVLLSCGQPREIPVLLPLVVHPLSGKPSKRFLSVQAGGFGGPCGLLTLLGACHSGEGGLLTLLGLGLGLGLKGLNRGPRLMECTAGRCRLTTSLYRVGSFARSAHHYHSPSIRGRTCRRQLSATLWVARLSTVGADA